MATHLNPLLRFLLSLVAVWIAAWFPIGIMASDLDYVLTPVSRDTPERQFYQIFLYAGLLLVFLDSWKRHKPERPQWGKPALFFLYFGQGLLASLVLRLCLSQLGLCTWSFGDFSLAIFGLALLSCLAVALVEEAVFRGFLLGHLVQRLGWPKGVWCTSAVFAAVHLFRPGPLTFKLAYGLGLLLLAYLLAAIAWHHNSIFASAGFHGGVIVLNLSTQLESFHPSVWSGAELEPTSGLVSISLTCLFLLGWRTFVGFTKPAKPATEALR